MYTIYINHDGSCSCECRIQDGTERWLLPNIDRAIQSLISAAYMMNGVRINRQMINYVTSKITQNIKCGEISSADREILDKINRGECVVLKHDDFRIKANLLQEEVETIFAVREGSVKVVPCK